MSKTRLIYLENKSLHLTIFDEYVFVIHTAYIQNLSNNNDFNWNHIPTKCRLAFFTNIQHFSESKCSCLYEFNSGKSEWRVNRNSQFLCERSYRLFWHLNYSFHKFYLLVIGRFTSFLFTKFWLEIKISNKSFKFF